KSCGISSCPSPTQSSLQWLCSTLYSHGTITLGRLFISLPRRKTGRSLWRSPPSTAFTVSSRNSFKLARSWPSYCPCCSSSLRNASLFRVLWSRVLKNNMLKVAVIGGGSTYTPELVNGFLARLAQFPLDELWLMDIDEERLNVVGKFAQRMVAAKGSPFKIVLSTNQRDAITNASYVTTQLRVGHMEARRRDEYLGLRHGLIGQE